jgi:hypothetical protein
MNGKDWPERAQTSTVVNADPVSADERIAAALNPCLCRCGCYPRITRAVHRAAAMIRGDDHASATHQPQPVRHELARPTTPWDKSEPGERDWFGVLGDGLVVVWPAPAGSAGSAGPAAGGAWLHVAPSGTALGRWHARGSGDVRFCARRQHER